MHTFLKLELTDSVVEQKLIKMVTEKSQVFKTVSLCLYVVHSPTVALFIKLGNV